MVLLRSCVISMHLHGPSLEDCPSDEQFLCSLDHEDVPGGTLAQRRYPPVALIECVADILHKHHKVRRLHLVIVDLWRPWKINQAQVRSLIGQLRRLHYSSDCTTPMSPSPGKIPLHGLRFVYGYSLDGSFLAIFCGRFVHNRVPFVCWSPKRDAMLTLNIPDSSAH